VYTNCTRNLRQEKPQDRRPHPFSRQVNQSELG
jgi:hypothetical protein